MIIKYPACIKIVFLAPTGGSVAHYTVLQFTKLLIMNDKFDSDAFRKVCGLWASGVSIITTTDKAGTPFGLTMNAVSSLSLTPPMFLVCVDNNSDTLGPMLETQKFGINMLCSSQQAISNNFAKKGNDKFDNIDWSFGEFGAPLISGALLSIECSVYNVFEGGDHQIVCGLVKGWINGNEEAGPLLYYRGGYQEFKS